MENNPWQVESIQAFAFLNCPECDFFTKDEDFFQDHAIEKHPLSLVFFGNLPGMNSIDMNRPDFNEYHPDSDDMFLDEDSTNISEFPNDELLLQQGIDTVENLKYQEKPGWHTLIPQNFNPRHTVIPQNTNPRHTLIPRTQ